MIKLKIHLALSFAQNCANGSQNYGWPFAVGGQPKLEIPTLLCCPIHDGPVEHSSNPAFFVDELRLAIFLGRVPAFTHLGVV
jgi:hypothetical protein